MTELDKMRALVEVGNDLSNRINECEDVIRVMHKHANPCAFCVEYEHRNESKTCRACCHFYPDCFRQRGGSGCKSK